MNMLLRSSLRSDRQGELDRAEDQAINDLRNYIFITQYNNLKLLQILNGAGSIAVMGFLSTNYNNIIHSLNIDLQIC